MNDYDSWLTTDRAAEEAERLAEAEEEAWYEYCEEQEQELDPEKPNPEVYVEWRTEWESTTHDPGI